MHACRRTYTRRGICMHISGTNRVAIAHALIINCIPKAWQTYIHTYVQLPIPGPQSAIQCLALMRSAINHYHACITASAWLTASIPFIFLDQSSGYILLLYNNTFIYHCLKLDLYFHQPWTTVIEHSLNIITSKFRDYVYRNKFNYITENM